MKASRRPVPAGLIALCFGAILLAQNAQPQADKLPNPAPPGTPNFSQPIRRPVGAELKVPPGFVVSLYAEDLPGVRWLQLAPNGDVFASQYNQNTITVLRDMNND